MKNNLLFFAFFILGSSVYALDTTDTIMRKLNWTLQNKLHYVQLKEERILNFKKIKSTDLTQEQEYNYNKTLFIEYQKFNSDSAIFYVKKNLKIASELQNKTLSNWANLQLVILYSSSGKYLEAQAILKGFDKNQASKKMLARYYEAYLEFFEHYVANSYDVQYIAEIQNYRNAILKVLEPSSLQYKIYKIQQEIAQNKLDNAKKELLYVLKNTKEDHPQYAMIGYLLGSIYKKINQLELTKKYYALSATADLKNANKNNASIQELALIFYEKGNVDMAYKLTQSAIEDALYCNVQFRTVLMTEVYSIINTAYLEKEAKRKAELQRYLFCISLLSVFLIVAVVYVYKQMKKLSRIRTALYETSQELADLNSAITETNNQLQERNLQLSESNHIKEEYIAHFFNLCSNYINKLENYRIILNKKATAKQFEEMHQMLKSTTLVDNELAELYKNFDIIFLNLYPTFVKDFNELLVKEEQIVLKQGEILNTELRIFALIRLGITDSMKIAAFLRYSISTIYNYRTKARNKAAVSRNDLEEMVLKIGLNTLKG